MPGATQSATVLMVTSCTQSLPLTNHFGATMPVVVTLVTS